LWDANLPHVAVETVPLEGDADGGTEDGAEKAPAMAWPRQQAGAAPADAGGDPSAPATSRSDDCLTGERPADLEQAFDRLETSALFEIARFQRERDAEESEDLVSGTLRLLRDCLAGDLTSGDREDIAAFIPRVLREALVLGDWSAATAALRLIRTCEPEWSGAEFAHGLTGSSAIPTHKVVAALDAQEPAGVESFLALAREFGSPLAEWLMHVLAESQQMRVRRPLARAIAELLAGQPARILPWLSDGRWYVVRNVVHILGWIGGNDIADGLRAAAGHAEPRVRREVVAALGHLEHDVSRPILMTLLASAEPELIGTVLHQLAMDDDPAVATKLLELLRDPGFRRRSEAERRALFLALASRGEPVLSELEAELNAGGLFSRRPEPDRQGIALCIARIGTPSARAILDRGLRSRHASIRKACLIAGASGGSADG
jgi:HEAT repeat protein